MLEIVGEGVTSNYAASMHQRRATRQIRRFEREQARVRVPVVAYTSISGNGLRLKDHGIDDVLEKPCEIRTMRDCLARWCSPQGRDAERNEVAALLRH